jgi:hypothetical protein
MWQALYLLQSALAWNQAQRRATLVLMRMFHQLRQPTVAFHYWAWIVQPIVAQLPVALLGVYSQQVFHSQATQ